MGSQSDNGTDWGVFAYQKGSSFSPQSGSVSLILSDPDEDPQDEDDEEDGYDASSSEDPRPDQPRVRGTPVMLWINHEKSI